MTLPIVKRYLIAFDQHKWTGITACILVTGVSFVAANVVGNKPVPPTQYQIEGILTYTQPPVIFSKTATDIQQQGQVPTKEIVLNNDVFRLTVEQLKLKPKEVARIAKSVEVALPKPPGKGEGPPPPLMRVKFNGTDDKQAVAIVNILMEEAVKQSLKINTTRLNKIIEKIKERLPDAKKELEEAERNLEQYTKREGSVLLAAKNGSLVQSILGAQAQQSNVKLQLEGIDSQITSLQQRLGLTPDQAYASSALSADPIIANLRVQIYQTESQLEILKKDLRPQHPNIIQLRKQLTSYEQLLRQRAKEVIGGNGVLTPLKSANEVRQDSNLDPARQTLANQLVALQTQKEMLQQQIKTIIKQEQDLRREYATIPNKQLEQSRLQERLQIKQNLYSKIQAALLDAQAAEAETVSSLAIYRPAQVVGETKETKNNVLIIIGAGTLVGFVVGAGIIFLLGSLGGVYQTMEDIRAALSQRDVEVLGVLPYLLIYDPEMGETAIMLYADSPALESYERFRSNLRLVGEKPVKVVLMTSTSNQEGKSVSAYNLGISSARAGKRTLVVEADLRSPTLAKFVKLAPDPDANLEPLRYYGNWSDCIRLVPEVENFYLVPSPGPVNQPAAILESSEFRRLLEDVRGRFDLVIIDSPALSLCNDALLLSTMADGMILVTRPGYTVGSMLSEAVDELTESEEPQLLGAIINGTDIPLPTPTPSTIQQRLMVTQPETMEQEQEQAKVPTTNS